MASLLLCLVFLSFVHYGMLQKAVTPAVQIGCSSKPGYIRGSEKCCTNFILANLYSICCTNPGDNVCYCDGNQFGTVCAAGPSSPSPADLPSLCPGSPQGRLLGATTVNESCSARGVVGLTAAGAQFCNAAYIQNPGTGQKVLYTLTSCWESAMIAQNANVVTTGVIFGDSFKLDNCTIENTAQTNDSSVTMLTLSDLAAYFMEQHLSDCPSPGCLYTAATMREAINTTDCFVVSYGFTAKGANELSRVAVKVAEVTQCTNPVPGTQCFVSDQGGAACLGDAGAPVYCSLSTGEVALYGIASSPTGCSTGTTSFSIFPIAA